MSTIQTIAATDISAMPAFERRLTAVLQQTAGEIARLESLDEEQRAEVYAILQAIQADAEIHQAMVDALASLRGAKGA